MLSGKQARSFAESTAPINIWEGAVRSGKTISSLLRWAEYVADAPKRGELAVIGKTTQTIGRNVFAPLIDPGVVGHSVARAISYTIGAPTATMFGRTVHVIGANDAKAEPKVRGLTGAGAYVDEITVVPEEFWNQLVARQSIPGAKIFGTTNPDNPAHWLRKKWLLAGNPSVRSWHFGLDDNPFLAPDYVAHLKRSYQGLWYRRFILGEWCAAEGAIYEQFDQQRHVVQPNQLPFITTWLCVAIDYGTTNPFHAVLIGVGLDHKLYVVAEYRWDSRAKQRQLTDVEYSRELRQWLLTVRIPGTELSGVSPQYVIVDPSATSFRVQMHRDGLSPWLADNEVLDGIRVVAGLFGTDQLLISAQCPALIDELHGYSWDSKAQEKGEDKPLKINDHGVDALRYGLKTTEPVWRSLVAPA
jgi:PBSX family phage terminase large subunit